MDLMAKIYPEDLTYYNLTFSENLIIEKLGQQLNNDYHIFYSLRWNHVGNDSECDVLIFNENLGFICIEVKGGIMLGIRNNQYYLKLDNDEIRYLKRSPHAQAELSMRYFLEKFLLTYNKKYDGIFGYAAAFPLYNIDINLYDDNATKEITINYSDLDNLKQKLGDIYNFFRKKRNDSRMINARDNIDFYQLLNKSIAVDIIKGGQIQAIEKQIQEFTRSQEILIDFIHKYDSAIIQGGAGTGKSYLAYKKASNELKKNRKVLFVTYSELLIEKAKTVIEQYINFNPELFSLIDFGLIKSISDYQGKYDIVIIDEAQELSKEDIKKIIDLSNNFYIFADEYQSKEKYFSLDILAKEFNIVESRFVLTKNIRSTAKIIEFLKKEFDDIELYEKSLITGSNPERLVLKSVESIGKYINDLVRELTISEKVEPSQITILLNCHDEKKITEKFDFQFGKNFESKFPILVSIDEYKGLENDIIIFIDLKNESQYDKYLSYTRAKAILYEVILAQ